MSLITVPCPADVFSKTYQTDLFFIVYITIYCAVVHYYKLRTAVDAPSIAYLPLIRDLSYYIQRTTTWWTFIVAGLPLLLVPGIATISLNGSLFGVMIYYAIRLYAGMDVTGGMLIALLVVYGNLLLNGYESVF